MGRDGGSIPRALPERHFSVSLSAQESTTELRSLFDFSLEGSVLFTAPLRGEVLCLRPTPHGLPQATRAPSAHPADERC